MYSYEAKYQRLHPGQDFEMDYQRLNQQYVDLNRNMFTVFLRYLADPSSPQLKRKADDTAPSVLMQIKRTAVGPTEIDIGPPCPYVHISALPTPPLQSPLFECIDLTEAGNRAIMMHNDGDLPLTAVPSPQLQIQALLTS